METPTKKAFINSNTEFDNITSSAIQIVAEYAFQNPDSINGPFGTLQLTLSEKDAIGEVKINTLWGLGSTTILKFTGENNFNPSTGYTSINAEGKGTINIVPNPLRLIKESISITLAPGFKKGEFSVSNFFSDFDIKITNISYLNTK